jgi:hypothetical protein
MKDEKMIKTEDNITMKNETKDEMKPKTVEEAFVSEYYALKEEVRRLEEAIREEKEESDYKEKTIDTANAWLMTFQKAIKGLKIVMNGENSFSITNCFLRKDEEGFAELKKVFEAFPNNATVVGFPPIEKD